VSVKSRLEKIERKIGSSKHPIIIAALGSDGMIRYQSEFMSENEFHERFPDDQYNIAIFEFGFPMRRGGL